MTNRELEAFWMPFTPNRQFKDDPRMFVSAKGLVAGEVLGREKGVTAKHFMEGNFYRATNWRDRRC